MSKKFIIILLTLVCETFSEQMEECESDEICARKWPNATCTRRGTCRCPPNSLRRASASRGWVCLSLLDAVTGMLGPPAICPLPAGAGYSVIERDPNGQMIACTVGGDSEGRTKCGQGYECIQGAGTIDGEDGRWDGICCPMAPDLVCRVLPTGNGLDGRLPRFFFDGKQCVPFLWAPEYTPHTRCANTFLSREQCESFCGGG